MTPQILCVSFGLLYTAFSLLLTGDVGRHAGVVANIYFAAYFVMWALKP